MKCGLAIAAGASCLLLSAYASAQTTVEKPAGSTAGNPPVAPDGSETPEDPRLTEGRALFVQGTSLAKQERWREALAAFERSASVRDHAATTYNLGFCERALGNFTRALKWYRKASADNTARGGSELPDDVRQTIETHTRELEGAIVRLQIVMQDPTNRLSVDDRPIEVFEDGDPPVLVAGTRARGAPEAPPRAAFALLVDPGEHAIRVVDAAGRDYVMALALTSGEHREVSIGAVPVPAEPSEAETAAPLLSNPEVESEPAAESAKPIWPWITIGVGTASLVGAGVLLFAAKSNRDELDECRRDPCPSDLQDEQDRANLFSALSLVALGAGAVAVGAGTVGLVTSRDEEQTGTRHGWVVSGRLTQTKGTLVIGGRF